MGQRVTSMPLRTTRPCVRLDHAAGHAEAGRLAGAVGAQQADDLALIDAEIDAVDDAPRAVVFHQSLDFKHEEPLRRL